MQTKMPSLIERQEVSPIMREALRCHILREREKRKQGKHKSYKFASVLVSCICTKLDLPSHTGTVNSEMIVKLLKKKGICFVE